MRLKPMILPILFTLSLILNGAAAGYFYSQWSKAQEQAAQEEQAYLKTQAPPFLSSISEDKRQAYLKLRASNNASLKEQVKKLRELRADLIAILGADTFSADAYKAKLDELIIIENAIQRQRIQPTLALAGMLSKEERQALTAQLSQPHAQVKPAVPQGDE